MQHINPQHALACIVKYCGPTNTRGSRVKLTFPRFNKGLTLPYSYEFSNAEEIALNFLRENGIEIDFRACLKDGEIIFGILSLYTHQVLTILTLN